MSIDEASVALGEALEEALDTPLPIAEVRRALGRVVDDGTLRVTGRVEVDEDEEG